MTRRVALITDTTLHLGPDLARIMAKRYGFKCTVLFGQTPDGLIKQGSSLIPGIEAIDDADMPSLKETSTSSGRVRVGFVWRAIGPRRGPSCFFRGIGKILVEKLANIVIGGVVSVSWSRLVKV